METSVRQEKSTVNNFVLEIKENEKNSFIQSEIINHLKQKGYSINEQRKAFVAGICTLNLIDDPVELWLFLRKNHGKISITSVYNNLRLMVKEQFLIKTQINNRSSQYTFRQKE